MDANTLPAKVKGKDASLEEFMEVMLPKVKKIAPGVDRADHPSPSKIGKTPVTLGKPQDPQETVVQRDLTDMEWMQQRMKGGYEDAANSEQLFEQSDSEDQTEKVPDDEDPVVKTILHTARLFVRNLTFTCTEDELRELFQPFGAVSQVSRSYMEYSACCRASFTSLVDYLC